jgi:preprotein translocase subunit SecE
MEKDNTPLKQDDKKESRVPFWQGAKNYIEDLRSEMRRVTWPTWTQVRATTAVVVFSVFAFAAYFTVVDFFIERGISKVFTTFTTR